MKKESWTRIEEEKLTDDISRKMFWGEKAMVVKWRLGPGVELGVHDHESEQLTMVDKGTITLTFPDDEDMILQAGDMLVIPSFKPHGVKVGTEGSEATDIFSPIRHDFLKGKPAYLPGSKESTQDDENSESQTDGDEEKYLKIKRVLEAAGIDAGLEDLKKLPIDLLARYVYEKECISMGELRKIMGLDKKQVKALLREWKHGDDHSESSLKRKLERLVILPWEKIPTKPER
jgi:quercetin dioxygenase-like cupin family protein